jgi:hypothetical protein
MQKTVTGSVNTLARQGRQEALYLELTALLIEREIAKLRRGEQAAHESFANVAKLVRNASAELVAAGEPERLMLPCNRVELRSP